MASEPAVQELEVFQGAYWSQLLIWKDELDVPIDNTGYSARMQVRRLVESADPPLITLTTGNGRIVLGGANGEILLKIAAGDTAALPATRFDRRWRYDLEMVPASGEVRRLMMGKFVVSPEVTR